MGDAAAATLLVGDIGGTNARFGLIGPDDVLLHSSVLADADFPEIDEAVVHYLGKCRELAPPRAGALAVAAIVRGDDVQLTNHPWRFSIDGLRRRLGFDRLIVINDFAAQALALPHLGPEDRFLVGGGAAVAAHPLAVIGPGTGLGVAGLIPIGGRWQPLPGEGGHVTIAPADERENGVVAEMRRHFDHVSAERCLSGPGLVNLYNTLAAIDGVPAAQYSPAQISDPAQMAADPLCREAIEMFCAMLGTVAGNLALTLGAQGGVYIAGGIVPRLGQRFAESRFRSRFEAKGRLRSYLETVPTYVVTHPLPAFVGLAAALRGNKGLSGPGLDRAAPGAT